MISSGLFKTVPAPDDERLARIQQNITEAFDAVAQALGTITVAILGLTASAAIPAGRSVVVFKGNTGQTVVLPAAKAQGDNVSAILVLVNTSGNNLTVRASAADTLDGAASIVLAAGAFRVLVSDGAKKWLSK